MIAVNLTEEQKRAQIESDTSLNMFVEAGAGAGKTTLIVKRIVNLLSKGINGVPVKPEEIVVITFTNKAAEELRERIIAAVSRSKDTMSEALQNLDRMNISTIHSFCNVLLREQGLTMGLPIDLELVDETENASLKRKYLNRYLHSLSANDWETVEQLGGEKKSRWNIKKDIEASVDGEMKVGNTVYLNIEFKENYDGQVKIALPNSLRLSQGRQNVNEDTKYFIQSNHIDYVTIYKDKKCNFISLPLVVVNEGNYKFENIVTCENGIYHISNSFDVNVK